MQYFFIRNIDNIHIHVYQNRESIKTKRINTNLKKNLFCTTLSANVSEHSETFQVKDLSLD